MKKTEEQASMLKAGEQIVKGYDPVILKRLFSFLKPYGAGVVLSLVALFIATAAELLLPVVMQRTIDYDVIPSFFRISSGEPVPGGLKVFHKSSSWNYFNKKDYSSVPDREQLMSGGIMDREEYYLLIPSEVPSELEDVLSLHKEIVSRDGGAVLIRTADMDRFSPAEKKLLRKQNVENISRATLVFLLLLIGTLVFTFIQVYLMAYIGQSVMKDIRMRLYGHTIRQSLGFLSRNPVGKLVTRITNDVETINEFFSTIVTSVLKDLSLIIGVVVVLFFLDRNLALVTLCTLPPVLILTWLFSRLARDAYRGVRLWVSRVNAYLSEHISGMAVVQMFNREKRSDKEFGEINNRLLKVNLNEVLIFSILRPMIDLLASVSTAAVIYAGALFFRKEILTLGVLIAFINLISRFYHPVKDISDKFSILQSAMAGGERLFELMDAEEFIPDRGQEVLESVRGKIRFDSVNFGYKAGEPVLRNLSFEVHPGETVAIVGYTGAGKTTITNLLTRLWDIDGGNIYLDDIKINEIPLPVLRRRVMPVLQDVFLFSGTIEENIRLGSDITSEQVVAASKIVQAHDFISALPAGYNTLLTERGSNLSTGQRQLISFARIVAHDPSILILDEATGNIDTETEKLIEKALDGLLKERTSLVIAHRLSTIRHADRIMVLNYGHLAEMGSHEELLEKKGIYYNLYNLQFSGNGE